ncbi:hypothetical protein K9M42_01290 [Patescibacteria group bacterium]|nr:hypothetical protein [Patescibacteria group bacterium]
MSERLKKILYVIGFLLLSILIAFLIYFFFFRDFVIDEPIDLGEETEEQTGSTGGLTGSPEGGQNIIDVDIDEEEDEDEDSSLVPVEDTEEDYQPPSELASGGKTLSEIISFENTYNPTLSPGGDILSYNKDTGEFSRLDTESGESIIFDSISYKGAETIEWSPDSTKVLAEFPDGSNVIYDFDKNRQYVLPTNWYNFDFTEDSSGLVFLTESTDPKKRWLSTSDVDGSNYNPIENLGENERFVDVVYSPNDQYIALSRTGKPLGLWRQQVIPIGLNDENFKAIEIEGRNYHPLYTPDGEKMVYDCYNLESNYKPILYVVDVAPGSVGLDHFSLNINTWVSKCTFNNSGTYLFCGVPRELLKGSGLFEEFSKDTVDDIYAINISTGNSVKIAEPTIKVNIESMFLSEDQSVLYYTDSSSGSIYSINLK